MSGRPRSGDTRTRCASPALSARPGKQCPPPTDLYRPSWPPSAASTCLLHADTRITAKQMKIKWPVSDVHRIDSLIRLRSRTSQRRAPSWHTHPPHRAVVDLTPAAAVRVRERRATCGGETSAGRPVAPPTTEMAVPSSCAVLPRASYRAVDCLLPPRIPTNVSAWRTAMDGAPPSPVRFVADGSGADRIGALHPARTPPACVAQSSARTLFAGHVDERFDGRAANEK